MCITYQVSLEFRIHIMQQNLMDTNIKGTLNVLNACKNNTHHELLVHTSTSEVYGTAQHVPIDENHPIVGQSPYSATKIAADKLVESYNLSFDLPIITARPFNTFGPRQTTRAIIPTIITQLLSNSNELKLGDISTTRDFNFVQDTVEGILSISENKILIGKVLNIGSGLEWSIEQTAKIIMKLMNKNIEIISDQKRKRPKNSEVERLLADNSLILSQTNWKPSFDFEDGLEKTINWIKNNKNFFRDNKFLI